MLFNLDFIIKKEVKMPVYLRTLSNDGVVAFYNEINNKIEEYRSDIEYTEKSLSDVCIDYVTKLEYKNDITADKRQISLLLPYLNTVKEYAIKHNIVLDNEKEIDKPKVLSKN